MQHCRQRVPTPLATQKSRATRGKTLPRKNVCVSRLTPAISSDQYFQRGGYDPNLSAEAQAHLANFQGKTSISSNQYLYVARADHSGREEEDEGELPSERDDFSELEASARAYYRKFMSNPDVQQGIETIRTGALKLSQYLEDFSRNGS